MRIGSSRIVDVDQREVVGRNRRAILRFQQLQRRDFFGGKADQLGQLGRRTNGVLTLPAPIFPEMVGHVFPVRMPHAAEWDFERAFGLRRLACR